MDALQKQINALSHKVDALYQIIDQMSYRVSEALSEKHSQPVTASDRSQIESSVRQPVYSNYSSSLDAVMEHKDVLVDGHSFDTKAHSSSEKDLAPEIQIKRLTAQLTAAYNRIASLEEQLLARRFH